MSLKNKIKNYATETMERYSRSRSKKHEIKKYEDKRRIDIYSKVQLTADQKKEIDDLYLKYYGEKIPYTWHRHFTAFSGHFDKYYFPELLFIPEFERYMNFRSEYVNTFSDKNVLPMLALKAGVRMPATIYSCISGIIQDAENNIISLSSLSDLSGTFFIKPTIDSSSGVGCQVLKLEHGIETLTGKSLKEILQSKGANWVIQELITCHPSITQIYPNSVNTFRVMTYIWRGEICHAPVIMRIGQGGANVDNAHAGGMFIAVDDDGTLHKTAYTEFKKEYNNHPDSHLKFDGYKIDLFPKVLKSAIKCHSLIPQIGCINWDFTIDENGNPVLIEANLKGGSVWLFQMAHGCGAFGDKTPEVLAWISLMNKTKKKDRYKYLYGKPEE